VEVGLRVATSWGSATLPHVYSFRQVRYGAFRYVMVSWVALRLGMVRHGRCGELSYVRVLYGSWVKLRYGRQGELCFFALS